LREALYLWYYFSLQAWQILPYWFTGILLGSVISVFAKARIHGLFAKLEGRRLGLIGLVPASIMGIASPLCMSARFFSPSPLPRRGCVKTGWRPS
jgi:hypothetical protein